jgi:anhydro-N-acetylmuramic acid kinase
MTLYTTLGIMTGTSCDGINGAVLLTDGDNHIEHLAYHEVPFSSNLSNALKQAGKNAYQNEKVDLQNPILQELNMHYTQAIIDFVTQKFSKFNLDLIGFHGQTLYHKPQNKITIQLGNPQQLANALKTNVIFNFRQNDLLHGGQGAPLVPLYHKACTHHLEKPLTFVNIGGVSNVTFIDTMIYGFDVGIGNCVSDDLCQKFFNIPYDNHGNIAANGVIHYDIAHKMIENDIFQQKPPKSFDRNQFDTSMLYQLPPQDAIATINYFTAYAIIQADKFYPKKPKIRIISGGGAYNQTLLNHLKNLSDIPVKTAHEINLNNNAIEAECFSWLAVRSIKNLPLSLPSTTGVLKPVSGGDLYNYQKI